MASQVVEILKEVVFRNRERYAIPPMDGALKPNDGLKEFLVIEESLKNPDDIAVDESGCMYVSAENCIIKLSGNGNKDKTVFAEFDSPAGGLSFHPDGRLIICVDGRGVVIFESENVQTWLKEVEGQPIKCPRCAIAGPDGMIYIVDGSLDHTGKDWAYDLMERRRSGRLIRYNPETEESVNLVSGLGHPYGLAFTHDGRSLIVTESWRHRVLSYPFEDIRPATRKRVIANLPGYPARIAPSSDGGYWMCLFAMRTNLVELVLTENKFRREMIEKINDPNYWLAPVLCSAVDMMEPMQAGAIRSFGVIKPWAPPRSYGLVIKLDRDMEPVGSWHSRPGGSCHGITGLSDYKGKVLVVSKGHGLVLKEPVEEVRQ